MRIRLHEIEIFSRDTRASQDFYTSILGLHVNHQEDGLNVLDPGWPGVDLDTSRHHPGKARLGFVVDSLAEFAEGLGKKGMAVPEPEASHLGMRILRFTDPDGNIVEVQELTAETPGFLRKIFSGD